MSLVARYKTQHGGFVEIRREGGYCSAHWITDHFLIAITIRFSGGHIGTQEIIDTKLHSWDPGVELLSDLGDYPVFVLMDGQEIVSVRLDQDRNHTRLVKAKDVPEKAVIIGWSTRNFFAIYKQAVKNGVAVLS